MDLKTKALEAADNAKLGRARSLSTCAPISRSGPLEPNSDSLGGLSETKKGLDQVLRERVFLLWEQAGRPNGRADEFWHRVQHQRWCDRAYALWEREGCPHGKANEHWERTLNFESI